MKHFSRTGATALLFVALSALSTPTYALPITADIVVLMDESGSMSGEQAWIKGVVTALDGALNGLGLTGNRYGSVGFAAGSGPGLTRSFPVGGGQFGTAAQFQAIPYEVSGATEDGYAAINAANAYAFRAAAARNYILVTDEDRDVAQAGLSFAALSANLLNTGTLLNAVLDASFRCGSGASALGIDSHGTGYVANGSGGFTTCTNATAVSGFGNTIVDYVALALASGGAAWDLNALRLGGVTATSFTTAFVAIKVAEIEQQPIPNVPEPASLLLLATGLAGAVRRQRRLVRS